MTKVTSLMSKVSGLASGARSHASSLLERTVPVKIIIGVIGALAGIWIIWTGCKDGLWLISQLPVTYPALALTCSTSAVVTGFVVWVAMRPAKETKPVKRS